jgi:FdhD protein
MEKGTSSIMKAPAFIGPLQTTGDPMVQATVAKVTGSTPEQVLNSLAIEEPLEIQLTYGPSNSRQSRSNSVTMPTPDNDFDFAAGFFMTEGMIRDANDSEQISCAGDFREGSLSAHAMDVLKLGSIQNTVRVYLAVEVEVNLGSLQRNFYTTSSCGICGKASLLALRTVCPPRATNNFRVEAQLLYRLPERPRASPGVFDRTGGLHGVGFFDSTGNLLALREGVGRHNAFDKLIGSEVLADQTPLRERLLLLSGRASFELLQKKLMSGLPRIAAVGAQSSLAV